MAAVAIKQTDTVLVPRRSARPDHMVRHHRDPVATTAPARRIVPALDGDAEVGVAPLARGHRVPARPKHHPAAIIPQLKLRQRRRPQREARPDRRVRAHVQRPAQHVLPERLGGDVGPHGGQDVVYPHDELVVDDAGPRRVHALPAPRDLGPRAHRKILDPDAARETVQVAVHGEARVVPVDVDAGAQEVEADGVVLVVAEAADAHELAPGLVGTPVVLEGVELGAHVAEEEAVADVGVPFEQLEEL